MSDKPIDQSVTVLPDGSIIENDNPLHKYSYGLGSQFEQTFHGALYSESLQKENPKNSNEIDVPLRVMKLLHESDPILKQEPLPWNFDENQGDPHEMRNLLLENMVAHSGLGLSANQIGMPVKVFSMYVTEQEGIVCFNPKITQESDELVTMKEGCLSYPELYLNVRRPQEISVNYQNADGDIINAHFEGLAARIFHHEMDHMMGKTFIDKVSRVFLQSARRKQKKLLRKGRQNGRTD